MERDWMMMAFYDDLRQYIGNYEYWVNFLKPHGRQRPEKIDYEIDLESIKGIDYKKYYNNPVKFKDLPESIQKIAIDYLLRIGKDFGESDVEILKKSHHLIKKKRVITLKKIYVLIMPFILDFI